MKVMIVDDEKLALQQFLLETEDMPAVEVAAAFSDPQEALDYMKEADAKDSVEAAFLDIEMPRMNGLILAEKLREIRPDLVVIFITGYEQYAFDAMKIKADYYMTKPYDRNDIEEVMERARLLARRQRKRVYFRTFGRFDMFVDGEAVYFANTKAKELLALCVDRKGGSVTIEEAVDKLWEGRAYDNRVKNLYRKAVMYLRQLLGDDRKLPPGVFLGGGNSGQTGNVRRKSNSLVTLGKLYYTRIWAESMFIYSGDMRKTGMLLLVFISEHIAR